MKRLNRGLVIGAVWAAIVAVNIRVMPARHAVRVQVEEAVAASMPLVIRVGGTLEPKASVTLRADFDGPILSKTFREGQAVKTGDLLLTIGRDKIRLEYQTRKDALTNARADLKRAHTDLRLQRSLYKKQAVAYSAVEDSQRALIRAEQALRAAEQAFAVEEKRWNSDRIVAPFSGTVVKDAVGGDTVVMAGREVATVANVAEYSVQVRLDEVDVKRIAEGQIADVRLSALSNALLQAKVAEIGAATTVGGITEVPVRLILASGHGQALRPGLSADVRIATGLTPPLISAPRQAIDNRASAPRLWRLGRWNRIGSVPVELGVSNPERVEIRSGLKPGDRYVGEALPTLEEGMKVRHD